MGVQVRFLFELQTLIILTMDLQELKYLLDYAKKHNMMHLFSRVSYYNSKGKGTTEYGGMVDTYALGAYAVMRVGSSPTTPTLNFKSN